MMKSLMLLASNIPAALIGGGVFLLSLFLLGLSAPLAIGVGVAGYLVGGLLIFPAQSARDKQRKQLLQSVLKDGEQQLSQIRSLRKEIKKPQMRQKIQNLADVGRNILEAVKKNPEQVRSAQQFSEYYLGTTITILSKYIELSEHRAHSADVEMSLAKAERMLDDIYRAFEKQLSALLRDDMLDLDTELSVLEETIELENL